MLSTGIPWEQEAEYVAACRTVLEPGEQIKHSEFSQCLDTSDLS